MQTYTIMFSKNSIIGNAKKHHRQPSFVLSFLSLTFFEMHISAKCVSSTVTQSVMQSV